MTDLFGLEQTTKRTNDRPEAAALVEVLKAVKAHPLVAWAERQNSGAARIGSRFVRFGWPGCPDVLGQLRDGRFLGVEVKAAKGRASPEQTLFLERINRAGGLNLTNAILRRLFTCLSSVSIKRVHTQCAHGPEIRPVEFV